MARTALFLGLLLFTVFLSGQSFDAELLTERTDIKIVNGKLVKTHHFEIKINNRGGEKYTKVSIPFSKLIKVSSVEAYLKDANGSTIRKLQKSEISERSSVSSISLYEDDYVLEFNLKHNRYPYILVYSYQSQQEEFIFLDHWLPVLDFKVPTHNATLTLQLPKDYQILSTANGIPEPTIKSFSNFISYSWSASYSGLITPEKQAPHISSFLPSVRIVPLNYKYDLKGSFKSWITYGDWHHTLLKEIDQLPEKEKNNILNLIKGIDDDREKIKVLYHYLQDQTRYINITIETGGLKPYPASYVAENKYGDCKALTNYFKSVLSLIGIESYYTKVWAGSPIKNIDLKFPSQQFNHIILFIPLDNDSIWLDCTSNGPFNYLGTFTQNRDALVVDEGNSRFLTTPKLTPEEVLESRNIKVGFNSGQLSKVIFNNHYKGEMFETMNEIEGSLNQSDQARVIRNYFIEEGLELVGYSFTKGNRDSTGISFRYETKSKNIYQVYGNDMLIHNIPFRLPAFEKPSNRKLPVQFDFPVYMIDTIDYELPSGYKLAAEPKGLLISNDFGHYDISFINNGQTIQVIKSLLINGGHYPVESYEAFYQFVMEIYNSENRVHLSLIKNRTP